MTPRTPLIAAALCAALTVGVAAPAAADSLVYVKDHNVWLSAPDGSKTHQVTKDGTADNPYKSPSQADDGTIVTHRDRPNGGPLLRLRQNGQLVNQIPLAPFPGGGPLNPHVSPDGTLVAYGHAFSRYINGYIETSSDVRYTRTDGLTPVEEFGEVGRGAGHPSWIANRHAMVGLNNLVYTDTLSAAPVRWWFDYDHPFDRGESVEDGEYAAGRVAVVRGEHDDNTIQLYRSTASFTTTPTATCTISGPVDGPMGRRFADPTFSPSGNTLAWQEGNGVWIWDIPAGDVCAGSGRLVLPGASEPDWGPADVNPGPLVGQPQAPPPPAATPATPAAPAARPAVPGAGDSGAATSTAAACTTLRGTKARARCVRRAKRAAALKRCDRMRGGARSRCVRSVKRRYG